MAIFGKGLKVSERAGMVKKLAKLRLGVGVSRILHAKCDGQRKGSAFPVGQFFGRSANFSTDSTFNRRWSPRSWSIRRGRFEGLLRIDGCRGWAVSTRY